MIFDTSPVRFRRGESAQLRRSSFSLSFSAPKSFPVLSQQLLYAMGNLCAPNIPSSFSLGSNHSPPNSSDLSVLSTFTVDCEVLESKVQFRFIFIFLASTW